MSDQYLFVPIQKRIFSYADVFAHKCYGIEDFDLAWQMINYEFVSELWAQHLAERDSK